MPDSNARSTRDDILRSAFRRIQQDNPSTEDLATAVKILNRVIRRLDSEGRMLWGVSNTPYALTVSAGTQTYAVGTTAGTIPTGILALERVELVINDPPYWPLHILSKSQWQESVLRGTTGQPLEVYLDKQPADASQTLWFTPTPDTAYTANLYYRRRLYDFDNAADNPDVPPEAEQSLIEVFTEALAPEFGISVTDVLQTHRLYAEEGKKQIRVAAGESSSPTPLRSEYF